MERQGITDVYLDKIQWLLDKSEHAGYIIDIEKATILYMNEAGKRVFHVDDSIVGKSPVEVGNMSWDATLHDLTANKYYTYQYYNKKANILFVVREKLVKWDGRKCVLRTLVDISTVKNMEETIAEKIRIENTLLNFISMLAGCEENENDDMLNSMLEMIGEFYSADRAYIVEVSEDEGRYSYEWIRDNKRAGEEYIGMVFRRNGEQSKDIYGKRAPVLIDNIEELKERSPKEYEYYKKQGIHCIYAVPYTEEGRVKGFVGVDNPRVTISNYALLKTMTVFVEERLFHYKLNLKREYDLYHDSLTGLKNRNGMRLYTDQVLQKYQGSVGVAVANINGLRDMNRDFGQDYGDKVFISFTEFLTKSFPNAAIFRLEGDEFIIISKGVSYKEFHEKVMEVEKEAEGALLRGASFGMAWTEAEEKDIPGMIHNATQKMIVSKRHYYERYQKSSKYHDDRILTNLLEEIKQGNFMVYFQPKIDVAKEQLVGMEALIRYRSEARGVVPPGKFVPLLEKEGLICHIDYFVLEKSCEILARWKRQGKKLVPISVNFSRNTMQEKDVVEKISHIIKQYNVPQEYILVEITETEGNLDRDEFVDIGSRIINNGIGISLDDFCSQYSCVSLLTSLPFKEIKFDKSMIDRISVDNNMKILCESMMETCNKFGYHIVAEGVETEAQLAALRGMNCNAIQGYYYCRPLSVEEFEARYFV